MNGWRLAVMVAVALPSLANAQGMPPMPGMAPSTPTTAAPAEKAFLDENQAAMDRMMAGMATKPTGSIDKDFVAMMIPHHQGAVEMAKSYLKSGTNPALLQLARNIVQAQQREIGIMRRAVK